MTERGRDDGSFFIRDSSSTHGTQLIKGIGNCERQQQ